MCRQFGPTYLNRGITVMMPRLTIGSLELTNPVILAPLAGITHLPFRLLCKFAGCGLVCSEMVSANGLLHKSPKTEALMRSVPAEKPLSVQIFGSDPQIMAAAAQKVAASGADIVDINFGCSVKKITKTGSGVALMKTPRVAEAILKAVRRAVSLPLTIKIRTGWEASGDQARLIADIAQDCGVDALTVHPRTARQGFGGIADWALIREIKSRLTIPIIGNGDIVAAEDALRMFTETGCNGVMVGRAAIGNPWLFSQILARLDGKPVVETGLEQRREVMLKFLDDLICQFGEKNACHMMRSQLGWFTKGLPHCSQFRESIKLIVTRTAARQRIDDFFAQLIRYYAGREP